jgi:hypothetical protein
VDKTNDGGGARKIKRRKEPIEDAKLQKIKRLKPKRVKKSMTKGALIKGMTKRLPYEILANPLFRVGLSRVMRGYAGILRPLPWAKKSTTSDSQRTSSAGLDGT